MSAATTGVWIHTPVPESVQLYKRIITARLTEERAEAEWVEARAHRAALEAEYRTIRVEHVA